MKEISLHILDIFQNSVRAESRNFSLEITESKELNLLSILISDDGKGMDENMLGSVGDAWTTSRTKRKIGLGIPLLKQQAEVANGKFEINSEVEIGTEIKVHFQLDHIDRQPVGDLPSVLKLMICNEKGIEVEYRHSTEKGTYNFSTLETKTVLDINDLNDNTLLNEIELMITENLNDIQASLI